MDLVRKEGSFDIGTSDGIGEEESRASGCTNDIPQSVSAEGGLTDTDEWSVVPQKGRRVGSFGGVGGDGMAQIETSSALTTD